MYELVADVERYPEFLPLCEGLTVRSRRERDGKELLLADMTVGYKAIRETFTTQVLLNRAELAIDVKYIEGPFRYLDNRWRFVEAADGTSVVEFYIDYEFKNRILGAVMGSIGLRAARRQDLPLNLNLLASLIEQHQVCGLQQHFKPGDNSGRPH
eukprot:gene58478-80070_t